MELGSIDVVALVLHLFATIDIVPPGWNAVVKWMREFENANIVWERCLRRMEVVDVLVPFQVQSAFVSMRPNMSMLSSFVR